MKTAIRVSSNFNRNKYRDAELLTKASSIASHFEKNNPFPFLGPELVLLNEKLALYRQCLADCVNGGKEQTLKKKESRRQLENVLRKIALYVDNKANQDTILILSCGLDLHQNRLPVGQLAKPDFLRMKVGPQKGTITLYCEYNRRASYYVFSYLPVCELEQQTWEFREGSGRKVTISGLESGIEYYFRVAFAGSNPERNWTEPVASFIL